MNSVSASSPLCAGGGEGKASYAGSGDVESLWKF